MTHCVIILKSAEQDLISLKRYWIKNVGQDGWQSIFERIIANLYTLKIYPTLGFLLETNHPLNMIQYRQIASDKTQIIYEIRQDMIFIHAICKRHQDMQSLIKERLLFDLTDRRITLRDGSENT